MDYEALDFFSGTLAALMAGMFYVLGQCRRNLRNFLQMGMGRVPLARRSSLELLTVPADWVKAGSPVFRYCPYAESADRRSASGIWSCEGPGTFEWQFASDETVFVLDGRVEIDYLGQHFVLEPGGTALFYAGTRALWHVPHYVRKSYMVNYPNFLVRLVRLVAGSLRRS